MSSSSLDDTSSMPVNVPCMVDFDPNGNDASLSSLEADFSANETFPDEPCDGTFHHVERKYELMGKTDRGIATKRTLQSTVLDLADFAALTLVFMIFYFYGPIYLQ